MSALRRLDLGRILIAVVLVVGTTAIFTKDQWDWVFGADEAQTRDVEAPTIGPDQIDTETERLFRISPDNGSEVRYVVEERLAGSAKTTVGTTTVVAGDILVDLVDPRRSTVGEIVVNVEMFTSDSGLRDKRIRHDFLESTRVPFARFVPTAIAGLPASVDPGTPAAVTITGELTVKDTTQVVTFDGVVVLHDDRVTAEMSTVILGSDFDVGPINIARLAHTDDEITLEFDLVADEVEIGSDADGSLETDLPADEIAGGAFAADVQPVLESNCVGCHLSGGPGWSTLALDTAGDAAAIADDIALVTQAGYMPPWLPSDLSPAFHNDWSLTDEELAVLAAWAADGGGLDVAPDTRLRSTAELLQPIRRDIVTNPAAPYVGSLDQKDDYRCLVYEVPDPEGDGTWITGLGFEPDQTSVVHHAIISRAPASAVAEIERRSALDDQPGYECFVGRRSAASSTRCARSRRSSVIGSRSRRGAATTTTCEASSARTRRSSRSSTSRSCSATSPSRRPRRPERRASPMSSAATNPLQTLVREAYSRWGIVVDPRKKQMVVGRLQKAARILDVQGLEALLTALREDTSGDVEAVLFDALSTNFTSFFREREHIDFLVDEARRSGRARLRYWSAGCSNGSEPYSLSIAMGDGLPDVKNVDLRILASDFAVSELRTAQRAVYPESAVASLPIDQRKRHLEPFGPGRFRVREATRERVTVAKVNLAAQWRIKGPFDAILCRNVMIYFDEESRRQLVQRFARLIRAGGHLAIGLTESITGRCDELRLVRPGVYQKIGATA